jgi:hypothetical protein
MDAGLGQQNRGVEPRRWSSVRDGEREGVWHAACARPLGRITATLYWAVDKGMSMKQVRASH